jgi:redox-sensitive bicupin YhaK (pirin superfamily)
MSAIEVHRTMDRKEGMLDVKRLIPASGCASYDPFVSWEQFALPPSGAVTARNDHGTETVTYLIAGAMRHEDSLGGRAMIMAGGAQRVCAARDVSMTETAIGGGSVRGVRVGVHVPQRLRVAGSDYQWIDAEAFPVKKMDGVQVVTIVGEDSPLCPRTSLRYYDVRLEPGCIWREEIPDGFRGLVYILMGSAAISGCDIDQAQACFMENPGRIRCEAREEVRLLACFGLPHG